MSTNLQSCTLGAMSTAVSTYEYITDQSYKTNYIYLSTIQSVKPTAISFQMRTESARLEARLGRWRFGVPGGSS